MQNIASIIQKVQIDLNQLHDDKLIDVGQNIAKNSIAIDKLNEKKFTLLQDRLKTSSDKKKLKLQMSLNRVEGYLGKLKSKIKINLESLKNNTQIKTDTKKRILNILQEMDSSTSDIHSDTTEGGKNVALPSSTGVGLAAKVVVEGKHAIQESHTQTQNSNANSTQTLYEKSSALLNNQLDAIKKSKFFKTLFTLIAPLIDYATTAFAGLFTGGAGAIIASSACATLIDVVKNSIFEKFDKKIENAKEAEKEIQSTIKANEKAMQQLLKNSQKSTAAFQKSAKALEYSQQN